jgi:serine protease Do
MGVFCRFGTCGALLVALSGSVRADEQHESESVLVVPGAHGRSSNARAATVQKVFPSAVRIKVAAAGQVVRSASGIAFAHQGGRTYVLTNAHVVETSRDWKTPIDFLVLPSNGQPATTGKVIAAGRVPDVDLAVLEIAGELPVMPLAPDDALELGGDVIVIGAPFGRGLSVAAGIVSQVEYERGEDGPKRGVPTRMKTDAAIGYGSSGGGVFDVGGDGRLVGLVEGFRTARVAFGKDAEQYAFDVPMPGETFVAPAAKIRRFLRDSGLKGLVPKQAAANAGSWQGRPRHDRNRKSWPPTSPPGQRDVAIPVDGKVASAR